MNKLKITTKTEWYSLSLIVLSFIVAPQFYRLFPNRIPIHWDLSGHINAYTNSFIAALLLPIIMVIIYILFIILPRFDLNQNQYLKYYQTYLLLRDIIISFLFVIYILVSLNGIGQYINIAFWMPIMVGALLVIIGILLKKMKTFWFLGFHSLRLYYSPDIQKKTKNLSNLILIILGILLILSSFVSLMFKKVLLGFSLFIILFFLPLYSYYLYKKERSIKKPDIN